MNIAELTAENFVIKDLKSQTKKEVLSELSEVFAEGDLEIDSERMVEVLLEREKLGSTGIGDGIAIPHGKLKGLKHLLVSFGKSERGIDFESLDGKPVHIFFMLIAPENSAGQHLKALAKISRMLKDEDFRQALMDADTPADMFNIVREKDSSML